MERSDALDRAKQAVSERNTSYGEPEDNFRRIANRWNAHLLNIGLLADDDDMASAGLKPHDVAIMLADVKFARLAKDPAKADNWIDAAGYAGCGAEVSGATDGELPGIKARQNDCQGEKPVWWICEGNTISIRAGAVSWGGVKLPRTATVKRVTSLSRPWIALIANPTPGDGDVWVNESDILTVSR